jgi:hypothetical protein
VAVTWPASVLGLISNFRRVWLIVTSRSTLYFWDKQVLKRRDRTHKESRNSYRQEGKVSFCEDGKLPTNDEEGEGENDYERG